MVGQFGIGMQNTVKPFTDIRVRKALTLGLDRYTGGRVLYPLTGPARRRRADAARAPSGRFRRPSSRSSPASGGTPRRAGSRREKLLAEAGFPNGFKAVLKNRNVKLPYQDFAVYAIQEWRKIGVEVENRPLETAAWFVDGRDTGNFELIVQPTVEFMDDPDQFLNRYITGASANYGRFSDPVLDDLFSRQARALDPAERKKLVIELQKRVLDQAYYMPGLWWTRRVVHWRR